MLEEILKQNPAFLGMSPEKLEFLTRFLNMEKPKNRNQMMPFLLAQMALARKKNIHFSKPEVQLIAQLLSSEMSPEEQETVTKMMKLLGS